MDIMGGTCSFLTMNYFCNIECWRCSTFLLPVTFLPLGQCYTWVLLPAKGGSLAGMNSSSRLGNL